MIGKVPKKRLDGKSSFRDLVSYIVGEKESLEKRAVYIQTRNMITATDEFDLQTAAHELEATGICNTRCKDPVFHFILSFRPSETPNRRQVDEAVDIALKEFGLENCKAVYGLQNDNGIHHIHVCVCRIDPETDKAISPANGWTHKAIMRAARKIEFTQGWEIEKSDPLWNISKSGEITQKEQICSDKPKLNSNAKDFEAHMCQKSAQTVAMEKGAPIIKSAQSWQELHEKLSEVGMKFERKGSGAVIIVNDEAVKASNAGRDCSLSQLEKRLGQFLEREVNSEKHLCVAAEATKQTLVTTKSRLSWLSYQTYKREHAKTKKERESVIVRQRGERQEIKSRHKRQRGQLHDSRSDWRGKGKELNLQKSLLAGEQLRERLLLQKRQKAELEKLPPHKKFLSYRKWLAENDPERVHELRNWRKIQQEEFKRERDEIFGRVRTNDQHEHRQSRDFGR